MSKVVFRHENRRHHICEIVELEDAYELRVQNKAKKFNSAYFDKNQKILDAITAEIENAGHPQWRTSGFIFCVWGDGKPTYVCSLSQIVYAAIQGVTASKHRMKFKDGNPFNLHCSNLYQCYSTTIDVVTLCDQKFILLKSKLHSGETRLAITDYDDQLLEVLHSTSWSYERTKRAFMTRNARKKERFSLQLIVIACLKYGATIENWREIAKKVLASFHAGKELSIDHKKVTENKNGKYDNRLINL